MLYLKVIVIKWIYFKPKQYKLEDPENIGKIQVNFSFTDNIFYKKSL